ncbi:hypothetical protein [Cupriavidus pampae]|uniref:Large polyvalent protein-associated domain-containing protein n=1 Tax=Cupriavidus pampae TaxID=659251 RepID=A0ABM8XZY2_9BURK|nr:hypothetical protein [Cupriavidus pampae]CAG9186010.1 hypothetical protein LMG32289_06211 [Cupriavidus pampae]
MSLLNLLKQAAAAFAGERADPPSNPDACADALPVGTGADNEFHMQIDGIPNLFRDEGDRVVHFVAEFDRRIQHTTFGNKLLPEVVPRWSKVRTYDQPGVTPQQVAEDVVREARKQSTEAPRKVTKSEPKARAAAQTEHTVAEPQAKPRAAEASSSNYTVGKLLEWGEMEFPNRKPGGKPTYTSFAVKLETSAGEKVLQGEGLKDVLASARCELGERVGIRRLHKEKVPAFDQKTGHPIIDRETNQQKFWDRWVWSINRIH